MNPRTVVILFGLVTLAVLGAVTAFGFLGLRDMQAGIARYHRLAEVSRSLAALESSLRQSGTALQSFLAVADSAKMDEAVAAMENARGLVATLPEFAAWEKDGAGPAGFVAGIDAAPAILRELERAAREVPAVLDGVVEPYVSSALRLVRENLRVDREDPRALALDQGLWEGLVAVRADVRAYAVARAESQAGRIEQNIAVLSRTAQKYAAAAPAERKERAAALLDGLLALDRGFLRMRECVHAAAMSASNAERNLHARTIVVQELLAVAAAEERDFGGRLAKRFDSKNRVMLSVGCGGLLVGVLLGLYAVVSVSRKRSFPL